jgi:betaine-aldehyde dehydrogenase
MPGQTAHVANLVSQIIAEVTSLPRGVVNIFTESGNAGAPYLVASPDVKVISYTGSTTVGRLVAASGAATTAPGPSRRNQTPSRFRCDPERAGTAFT